MCAHICAYKNSNYTNFVNRDPLFLFLPFLLSLKVTDHKIKGGVFFLQSTCLCSSNHPSDLQRKKLFAGTQTKTEWHFVQCSRPRLIKNLNFGRKNFVLKKRIMKFYSLLDLLTFPCAFLFIIYVIIEGGRQNQCPFV